MVRQWLIISCVIYMGILIPAQEEGEQALESEQPVNQSVKQAPEPTQKQSLSEELNTQSLVATTTMFPVVHDIQETGTITQETPHADQFREQAVIMEQEAMTPDISAQDIKGISTISLDDPRGNWLFKRVWWEHAQEKIEKIRLRSNDVYDARIKFFEKRIFIEKNIIEPFYITLGLSQGQLREIISEILSQLNQIPPDTSATSDTKETLSDNKIFLTIVQQEQAHLEMLQKYTDGIVQLDADTDMAIGKLIELIHTVRTYEQEAWSLFKEISRVLSDIAARDLFLRMSTISRNIQAVHSYIYGPLSQHCDLLIQKIENYADESKKLIEGLREKGIDLKGYAEKISRDIAKGSLPAASSHAQEESSPETLTWWQQIGSSIHAFASSLYSGIVTVVTWPFSWFIPSSVPEHEETDEKTETNIDKKEKDQ